jgi:Pyridoxamine 5'-phosphate oxidase
MVTWNEFENDAPDMAEAGKKLLYQFGVGLGFLATLRKDGAPRLHPICPTVVDGRLYALIGPTPKRADLKRDGRYALHTFPAAEVDDEFLVMGRATFIDDPAIADKVRTDLTSRGMKSTNDEIPFEFGIERVMHAKYPGGHGTWPPKYSIWKG